ncbi:MAG TPA: Rieske (2Fe-2S) protein [Ignavibacteriaceae bacterium]|nr:Rieske (2Fe-2S) protein [Ignavibacteriaceae bacterium]
MNETEMNEKEIPQSKSRRKFLSRFLMSGGLLASSVLLLRHGIDYIFPSMDAPPLRKMLIGRVEDLKIGEAKEVHVGESILYLVKNEDGYKVFSSVCTHLGCKVNWESYRNRFYCPCHKGIFDSNGNVIEGPPPRPLDEFKVEVDKNLVYMWIEEKDRRAV